MLHAQLGWVNTHLRFMHNYGGTASTPVLIAHLWWDRIHTCASHIFMMGQCPHLCFMHIYGVTLSTRVLHAQCGTFRVGQHPHLCFMDVYRGTVFTNTFMMEQHPHLCFIQMYGGKLPYLCFTTLYGGTAYTPVLHAHLWCDIVLHAQLGWDSIPTML